MEEAIKKEREDNLKKFWVFIRKYGSVLWRKEIIENDYQIVRMTAVFLNKTNLLVQEFFDGDGEIDSLHIFTEVNNVSTWGATMEWLEKLGKGKPVILCRELKCGDCIKFCDCEFVSADEPADMDCFIAKEVL